MTSAFDRYSKPGDRHAAFAPMIGQWRIAMATHKADGSSTRSDDVRAAKSWFGDGRYIREVVSGTFGGAKHEKLTVLGFNNVRNRYEYSTADNYDAAITLYTTAPGASTDDPRRIEMFTDYVDAGTGRGRDGHAGHHTDAHRDRQRDRHTLRNFYKAPGQTEYLFLEYDYRREA